METKSPSTFTEQQIEKSELEQPQQDDLKLDDEPQETPKAINERPFLLLDIRQAEDYKRSHIVMAKSYPASRLSRAVNFETK